jgi:APA family basic amino acid/polyamine antiporter
MSNPRVMYAMSQDGVLPKIFMRTRFSTQVMFTSLSVFAAICVAIIFYAKQFDEILSFTIFLDCIGMATSAATIFILRNKAVRPPGKEIYTMKLYPLQPIIFIIAYLFVAISIFLDKPRTALTGICVLALFIAVYFVTHFFQIKKAKI